MKSLTRYKDEIDKTINWYFQISGYAGTEPSNINIIRDLIRCKIACMSHTISVASRGTNSMIKHYDREDIRNFLKDYAKKEINKRLEEEKNGKN